MEEEHEMSVSVRDFNRLFTWAFGNGQPGLEARLVKYIDERDAHKERNSKQEILDLRKDHEDNKRVQDERHLANTKTLGKIEGAASMLTWGIPVLLTLISIVIGLLGFFVHERLVGKSSIVSDRVIVAQFQDASR